MENLPGKDGHYKLRDQVNWITPKMPSGGGCPRNTPGGGLRKLEDQTEVNWPTPQEQNFRDGRVSEEIMAKNSRPLQEVVISGLPVPDSSSTNGKSRELWRTPDVGSKGNVRTPSKQLLQGKTARGKNNIEIRLTDQVAMKAKVTNPQKGKLNPAWTEQLMGIPVGWTDLGFWATG